MKNKKGTALITGGAKRVGHVLSLRLAQMGYDIALHYNHSKKEALKTKSVIEDQGQRCELFQCDLFNEKKTTQLIAQVYRKFSDLNLIINSASIFDKTDIKKLDLKSLNQNWAIHCRTPYILMSQFHKMCGKGQVINILETHIVKNQSQYFNYLLTKKALASLTKMAAVHLAPHIRVNGIAPGLILAPEGKSSGHLERLSKDIPLKTIGSPEQIADCIGVLLENPYLTGQIIFNDGGEHLL